jgi:hypothetical protein
MGYYTYYTLEVEQEPSEELLEEELYGFSIESWLNDIGDELKWYGHEADMIELSKRYPEYLFILTGTGEQNDDLWRKWFKDGKWYKWFLEYTIPDFEESKLK